MKPWQRALLRRWSRVGKGMMGVGLIAAMAIPLSMGDNLIGHWMRSLDNPRLAFALVFVGALIPFVGAKLYFERRQPD